MPDQGRAESLTTSVDRDRLYPTVQGFAQSPVWVLGAEFMRSPAFETALHAYCAEMSGPPSSLWPSNKIFAQKLRYITCYMLIGNYTRWRRFRQEPPTLAALKAVVNASPRQVAALIAALRAGGHVVAERSEQDRRTIHLRPGPLLLREIAKSPLLFLAASEAVSRPATALADAIGADDDRLCDWMGRSTEEFRAADILFAPFPTIVNFTERDSGYLLLTAAMAAHYAARAASAKRELPLTYDALAAQFQVSRQHIGNILADAERQGLFVVRRGALRQIDPDLVSQFETWAAGQMAHYRRLAESLS